MKLLCEKFASTEKERELKRSRLLEYEVTPRLGNRSSMAVALGFEGEAVVARYANYTANDRRESISRVRV